MDDESYSLNNDGTITFEFSGITRVLKRPTLRQYREAVEGLEKFGDLSQDGERVKLRVQLSALTDWYDDVFKALAGEGLPRDAENELDEDKLPSWLLSQEIVGAMVLHWQAVPSRRGGR